MFYLPAARSSYVINHPFVFTSPLINLFRVSRSIIILSHNIKVQLHMCPQLHHQQTTSNLFNLGSLAYPTPHLLPISFLFYSSSASYYLTSPSFSHNVSLPKACFSPTFSHNVSLVPHTQRSLAKMTSSKVKPPRLVPNPTNSLRQSAYRFSVLPSKAPQCTSKLSLLCSLVTACTVDRAKLVCTRNNRYSTSPAVQVSRSIPPL